VETQAAAAPVPATQVTGVAVAPTPAPEVVSTSERAPTPAPPTAAPASNMGRPPKRKADTSGTGQTTEPTRKSKRKTAGKKR
jgi:hypothetical protein